MKKIDLFRSRIDGWVRSASQYLGMRMNAIRVDKRKKVLIIVFVMASVLLVGQTVMAFLKLHNNI